MAAAPGALELLPNQFYPRPWLHVRESKDSDMVLLARYCIVKIIQGVKQ
jgi:hypothetical protein